MANLHETAEWTDDIYRIELDDPVEGGEDGVDNRPHKELANRTLWLKSAYEQLVLQMSELTAKNFALQEKMERLEILVGGSERLDGLAELENRVLALELNKATANSLYYLQVNIIGENNTYTVSTKENVGGFVVPHAHLQGDYPKSLSIRLPSDYDDSTHRYTVKAYPLAYASGLNKAYGTEQFEVKSDSDKTLVIEVPAGRFVSSNSNSTVVEYVSMSLVVEVMER